MSDATVSFDDAVQQKASAESRPHDRSTIDFPYLDQDAGIEVARAIYERGGHSSCELDELAAQMGQTLSGTFRMKTASARLAGFVEKDGRGKFRLTELGQRVVTQQTETEARSIGFLNVPLYRAIYEKYRGHLLPPPKALEREMVLAGVAPKQAGKARQAMERSAEQAGFFVHGEDRLVAPRFDSEPQTTKTEKSSDLEGRNKFGGGRGRDGDGTGGSEKAVSEVLLAAFDPNDMDQPQQEAVWTLLKYFKSRGL